MFIIVTTSSLVRLPCKNDHMWYFKETPKDDILAALLIEHHQFMEFEAIRREIFLALDIQKTYAKVSKLNA